MMPNLNRLISETLTLPADALVWELSRRVADLFPGQYVLETTDYDFKLDEYARDGRCSLHLLPDAYGQLEATWDGRRKQADLEPRNAYFEVLWRGRRLHVLSVTYYEGYSQRRDFIVADDMPTARDFFSAVCAHSVTVEGQILVYQHGTWKKDAELMQEISSARFEDLVLADGLREALVDDIEGFFASRELYESLGVAWKRGVLLFGPPGNGKTHALKAIVQRMKVPCLYVRSFRAERGTPARHIERVFSRARLVAPCLLVLEDLDSLVPAEYLSTFLNEMDGFAENRGVLTVATTNHPGKLDPALLERPSRFDRKVTFELPRKPERLRILTGLDAKRPEPMRLTPEELNGLAVATKGFSFAYLKELHVAATMAWMRERRPGAMGAVTLGLVEALRKQMRNAPPPPKPSEDEEDDDEE